ncbi:MAG: hypothetical protein ACHP7N_09245 [Caulobacterales bacterium]
MRAKVSLLAALAACAALAASPAQAHSNKFHIPKCRKGQVAKLIWDKGSGLAPIGAWRCVPVKPKGGGHGHGGGGHHVHHR